MPTIPPNNSTGLYGIDGSSVAISNDVTVDNLAATGNITAGGFIAAQGNITSQGNISADYFIGDGSQLTNINAGNIVGGYGNANVVDLLDSFGSNVIVTTGNITGGFIFGNGSQLTGLPATYSNANVTALLSNFGSNTIVTTGNITGGYIFGNGSQLTGLPATYSNANVAAFLPTYTGNLSGGNLAIGNNANILNDLTVGGTIYGTFAGNISGNLVVPGANTDIIFNNSGNAGASSNLQFDSATDTLELNGQANVTGNITASYFVGNGSQLTGLPASYGNANVAAYLPTYTGNIGNTASQLNIVGANVRIYSPVGQGIRVYNQASDTLVDATSATTVSVPGAVFDGALNEITVTKQTNFTTRGVTVSGNIFGTGNSIVASGNIITNANITGGNLFGTIGTASQTNITTVGTLTNLSVAGNANVQGNSRVNGFIQAGTEVRFMDEPGGGDWVAVKAPDSGLTTWTLTLPATDGNSGQFLQTNGSGVTTWATPTGGTYGNANVADFLANGFGSNNISTTGNVAAGSFTAESGLNFATVNPSGIAASGNIQTSGTFVGSGAGLSSIPGANVTGTVASATQAATANVANSVSGGNVSGQVANALVAGTVYTAAQPAITSVGTLTSLSVTGNITGGNVNSTFFGSGAGLSSLTGANVTGTVANATFATSAGSATTATTAGTVTTNAQPNITSVGTLSSLTVSGNIGTGGILTDGYYYANGTPVTFGGGGTYGDSNVNTLLASWGSNTLSTTGNITGGNLLGTIRTSNQPNITNIGTLSSLNVTGNITGGNLISNGQIVAAGNITGADISGDNLILSGGITANDSLLVIGDINADGNIIMNGAAGGGTNGANIDFINGGGYARFSSDVTSVSGHLIAGTPGSGGVRYPRVDGTNGQVLQTYGNGIAYFGDLSNVAIGNITSLTVTGTVTAGGFVSTGVSSNISGANVISANTLIANTSVRSGAVTYTGTDGTAGQVLTTYGNGVTYFSTVSGGSGSPGGANTQLQFNDGGAFAGNAAMTFDKTNGNIGFGNLVIGNIGTSGTFYNVFTNKNTFLGNSATQPSNARILMGSGRSGDWGTTPDLNNNTRNARVVISDEYIKADNGVRTSELAILSYANLNGSTNFGTANTNSRIQGQTTDMVIYGGNITTTNFAVSRAMAATVFAGTGANTGNANISHLNAQSNFISTNAGSTVGNGIVQICGTNFTGVLGTQIGLAFNLGGNANNSGNTFCVYNPPTTVTYGLNNGNAARGATNYYFLRNDDDVAQCKLGSLRLFNEFRNTATISSGAVTIDKNNGQVQYVDVTEAITSITFSNFVRTASDGTNTDQQTDTVTVILRQDATGRTVTMPSGSGFRYAGGVSTVGTTANSVTMISVTGITNAAGTGIEYLITVSPEFV